MDSCLTGKCNFNRMDLTVNKPHKMLTARDYRRHALYLKVLELCKEPKSCLMLEDVMYISEATISQLLYVLKENNLKVEIKTNKNNIPVKFYTTIKADYPIEDLIPISIIRARKKINRQAKLAKPVEANPESPSHIRIVSERHVKSSYTNEFRGIGSSIGMAW